MKNNLFKRLFAMVLTVAMLCTLPIVSFAAEKPVELIWYIVGGGEGSDHEMVMEELNKILVEKINVKLDLRVLGWGEYDEQMKLITTSGEDYDLCFTCNWMNSFTDNISREAFLDITELYEQYGQDIAAQLPSWIIDVGRVNGKLYGITNFQGVGGSTGVCIQKSLMDKYNITFGQPLETSDGTIMMMNYDELAEVMDILVANEPDMIPLSLLNTLVLANDKYENFANGMVYVDKNDPTMTCVGADVALEADLRLRNEWYNKGYIRQDIATNSDESPLFAACKFAILLNGYKKGVETEYALSYGSEWVQSAVNTNSNYAPFVGCNAGAETMTAINVNTKHPVEAMKLLNLVYTDPEVYNMLVYGLEGVHYNKVDDNFIEVLVDGEVYGYPDWELGNVFLGYRTVGKEYTNVEIEVAKLADYEVSQLRGFVFDPVNVQSELAQLSAVEAEFANMEYVTNDIDQLIADRNQKLKNAGLDRVVAEVQRQINEWRAASGK